MSNDDDLNYDPEADLDDVQDQQDEIVDPDTDDDQSEQRQPPDYGKEIEEIRNQIEDLKSALAQLEQKDADDGHDAVFPITTPGDGTWKEAVPKSDATALETPATLRQCTSASAFSKLLNITDLDATGAFALEMQFAAGHRYFKLSGQTAGKLTPIKVLSPGSGTTTATDSWALASDKKAVSCDVMMRAGYDSTAHKFYNVTRLFTEDSNGNLASISAETLNYFVTLVTGGCT